MNGIERHAYYGGDNTYEGVFGREGVDPGSWYENAWENAKFKAGKGAKTAYNKAGLYGKRGLAAALTAAAKYPAAAGWAAGSAALPVLENLVIPKHAMDRYIYRDNEGQTPEGFGQRLGVRAKGMVKDSVDGATLGLAGAALGWHKAYRTNRGKDVIKAINGHKLTAEQQAIRDNLVRQGVIE